MFLSIAESFLHASKWLAERYEFYPTFNWIWVLYVRVHCPVHVFTNAGFRSLSEDLDRPITPCVFASRFGLAVWR